MRATLEEEGGLTPLTFFIDRSLGQEKVVAALRARGANVEPHDAHFARDAADAVWLADVGARGWVVISKDARIRYRGAELAAARSAGVALFIFRGGNMTGDEIAAVIAGALEKMVRTVQAHRRPFIATISKAGVVRVVDE